MEKKGSYRQVEWLSETPSTNTYMETKLNSGSGYKCGDTVVAGYQTRGKGNGNNQWESAAGKNLTFSVYYESGSVLAHQQFYLNMAVSLGVADFVKSLLPDEEVSIKWPNDIYINKGKVAGMLIKHVVSGQELLYSILGIGLNVNQEKFVSDAPNPVALIHFLDQESDLQITLDNLLENLVQRLDQLEAKAFNQLKSEYLARLFAYHRYRKYLYENRLIKARIMGVSEYGSLQLEGENGALMECDLKEIRFVL